MPATIRDYLESQRQQHLNDAAKIVKDAQQTSDPLTDDQKSVIGAHMGAAEELAGKVKAIDEAETFEEEINKQLGAKVVEEEEVMGARSVGDAFVKSDGYARVKSAGARAHNWSTGPVAFGTAEDPFGTKATVSTIASAIVPVDYRPGIFEQLTQPPRVSQLFAQATTDSNVVNYVRETTATNAADEVSQGALKPESTLIFTNQTTNVRKIATFLPVTDEMLEDVAQIRSYLDTRLSLFVRQAEDDAVLNGNGTDPALLGVLNAGIHTANATALVGDNHADAFYQAITTIRDISYLEPDAIVMHPQDWAVVRLSKDESGQYYGGGPFTGAYGNGGIAPNNIWGLPVVITTAITVNTALVGAFQLGGTVYRKSGLTVEASNSHLDWFQRNMTAIRAETRLALAIHRPQAFFKITNLDDTFS